LNLIFVIVRGGASNPGDPLVIVIARVGTRVSIDYCRRRTVVYMVARVARQASGDSHGKITVVFEFFRGRSVGFQAS
jgi:hypothetical protein